MNDIASKKKVRIFLKQVYAHAQKSKITPEMSFDLANFLLKYLSRSTRPSKTSKILDCTSKFLTFHPLRFAISLVPYFSSGHIQDTTPLFHIFKTYYFANESLLNLCISSLILSCFAAVSSSEDFRSSLVEVLDKASPRNRVYECIWKAILKCPKARLPALNYLHYRLLVDDKSRALHALLACLGDPLIQVKRCALDLLRRVFNFNRPQVDRPYKLALLVQALLLFENNEKSLLMRVFEWINPDPDPGPDPDQEVGLNQASLEIISEALMQVLSTLETERATVIISNFVCSFKLGKQVLSEILIPMALYHRTVHTSLRAESIVSLLHRNAGVFWMQLESQFIRSFDDKIRQEALFSVLKSSLIQIPFEYKTVDTIVCSLIEKLELDTERYLKYISQLLYSIEKTGLSKKQVRELHKKAGAHRSLLGKILLRCDKLQVDCAEIIEELCSSCVNTEQDRIEVINIRLEYKHKTVKKEDIEFVLKYSLRNSEKETIDKLVKLFPKRVNSLLDTLFEFDTNLAISSLIHIHGVQFQPITSVLVKAIELLKDSDVKICFDALKWLNLAITSDSHILSSMINTLVSKSKSPKTYITDCCRILANMIDLIRLGGSAIVNVLLQHDQSKLIARLEEFIINPPYYSGHLRILAMSVACEIVKYSSSEKSLMLVEVSVSFLLQCIKAEDNQMLLLILQVLENHLLVLKIEANDESSSKGLFNILGPLVKIIGYPDLTVRNSWLKFIAELIPFIIEFLDTSISIRYTNALLKRYFEIFSRTIDGNILNALLDITKLTLMRSLHNHHYNNLTKVVYFSLQKYLELFIDAENSDLEATTKEIIYLLWHSSPCQFVKGFVLIWIEYCPYDRSSWSVLDKYIDIMASLSIAAELFITEIKNFVNKHYDSLAETPEKILSIGCLISKVQEKLGMCYSKTWSDSILIYKYLENLQVPEGWIFIMESLYMLRKHVLSARTDMPFLFSAERVELKKIVKGCLNSSILYMHSEDRAASVCYRFVENSENISISEVYMGTMKCVLHEILRIGMNLNGSSWTKNAFLTDTTKLIFNGFRSPEDIIQRGSAVIIECLRIEEAGVYEVLHERVIALIKRPDFLGMFRDLEQIHAWKCVVKSISEKFYKKKNRFLEKIIEYVEPGMLSRMVGMYKFREDSLKLLAFTVILGDSIEKRQILMDIGEILFNTIGTLELFSSSCLILKSLYLKTTEENFSEVLYKVLPALFPVFMQGARDKNSYHQFSSCLKLLEFFFLTENEAFFIFQGMWLHSFAFLNTDLFLSGPLDLIRLSSDFILPGPLELTHLNSEFLLSGPVELNRFSSSKTDIDVEVNISEYYVPLNFNNKNIDIAIWHTHAYISSGKCIPCNEVVRSYLEESITFDLIN